MIIQPKYRGFICLNAHPTGCAKNVQEQINYAQKQIEKSDTKPKNVLVIGSSTGYGLASRVVAAFGYGAKTLGVAFEREAGKDRTASAGYYNTETFERAAQEQGLFARSINGDAFSNEIKQQSLDIIKNEMGKIDLIVYSLASPKRKHPDTCEEFKSVIKPIGETYCNKTVDFHKKIVSEVCVEPATEDEVRQTIAVMGGEDWRMWIDALKQADLLADHAITVAYSYIGPELTHAVYTNGTIGAAKKDLEATAQKMNTDFIQNDLHAYVSVNKALVTQASSAIPVVPLYMSILFKIMIEKGTHEGCIEQMVRLFSQRLYTKDGKVLLDEAKRIRLDDWEMEPNVQVQVEEVWQKVDSNNLESLTAIDLYTSDFFKLFGFGRSDVNYELDVEL